MIFGIGLVLLAVSYFYGEFFTTFNNDYLDVFFFLLAVGGVGCIITSLVIFAVSYLP